MGHFDLNFDKKNTQKGHFGGKQLNCARAPPNRIVEKIFLYIRDEIGT